MRGNMYCYYDNHTVKGCTPNACKPGCKYQTLDDALNTSVKHFTNKFGYKPEYIVVNPMDYARIDKFTIRVASMRNCPKWHFILCHPIARKARIFHATRIAFVDL